MFWCLSVAFTPLHLPLMWAGSQLHADLAMAKNMASFLFVFKHLQSCSCLGKNPLSFHTSTAHKQLSIETSLFLSSFQVRSFIGSQPAFLRTRRPRLKLIEKCETWTVGQKPAVLLADLLLHHRQFQLMG